MHRAVSLPPLAVMVLFGVVQTAAGASLSNGLVTASFDDRGLVALHDHQLGRTIRLEEDGFSFIIEHHLVDSSVLAPRKRTVEPDSVRYVFRDGPFTADVVYRLRPGWRFVTKRLSISNTRYDVYTVRHVDVFRGRLENQPASVYVANMGEKYKRSRGFWGITRPSCACRTDGGRCC